MTVSEGTKQPRAVDIFIVKILDWRCVSVTGKYLSLYCYSPMLDVHRPLAARYSTWTNVSPGFNKSVTAPDLRMYRVKKMAIFVEVFSHSWLEQQMDQHLEQM